jgi:hypothetical protein
MGGEVFLEVIRGSNARRTMTRFVACGFMVADHFRKACCAKPTFNVLTMVKS